MSDYRDDQAALRQANASLEDELEERDRELRQKHAELAAKDQELLALRERLGAAAQPTPVTEAGLLTCAACGKANQPHYKFCLGCGGDFSSALPAGAAQPDGDLGESRSAVSAGIPEATRPRVVLGLLLLCVVAAGVAAMFAL